MSAQLGMIQPSHVPNTLNSKGSNTSGGKKKQTKQVSSNSPLVNSKNNPDFDQFLVEHHFIKGRTLTFYIPSSEFRLFYNIQDCYGPSLAVMLSERCSQQLEELVETKLVSKYYTECSRFRPHFGWKTQTIQKVPCRAFYNCQFDPQVEANWKQMTNGTSQGNDEQKEDDITIKQRECKGCRMTLITWEDDQHQWRYRLVNIHPSESLANGLFDFMTQEQKVKEGNTTNQSSHSQQMVLCGDMH